MSLQIVPLKRLKKWIKDYVDSRIHGRETMNIVLELNQLKEFIRFIDTHNNQLEHSDPMHVSEKAINAVRFYFVRQNDIEDTTPEDNNTHRDPVYFDANDNPQTQISIVGVPVINHRWAPYPDYPGYMHQVGKDYIGDKKKVPCVYPSGPYSEHTGMCPYNCTDSLNEIYPQENDPQQIAPDPTDI